MGIDNGTLSKNEQNPNKSHAIVLRIYIDDATVAFSSHSWTHFPRLTKKAAEAFLRPAALWLTV
jgi:hypothetical protein